MAVSFIDIVRLLQLSSSLSFTKGLGALSPNSDVFLLFFSVTEDFQETGGTSNDCGHTGGKNTWIHYSHLSTTLQKMVNVPIVKYFKLQ